MPKRIKQRLSGNVVRLPGWGLLGAGLGLDVGGGREQTSFIF